MNALEKVKLSKERIALIAQVKSGAIKGLDKVKASKRIQQIVIELGGKTTAASTDKIKFKPKGEFFNLKVQSKDLEGGGITISAIRLYETDAKLNGLPVTEVKLAISTPYPDGISDYSVGIKLGNQNSGHHYLDLTKVPSDDEAKAFKQELNKLVNREINVFKTFAAMTYQNYMDKHGFGVTSDFVDLAEYVTQPSDQIEVNDSEVEKNDLTTQETDQNTPSDDQNDLGDTNTPENENNAQAANGEQPEDGLSDNTNDENYRWKDTAYIAGAKKYLSSAFSEAKKEGRTINTSDIDWQEVTKDMRLAQSLVTKGNVFGVVDWKGLKDSGMPSDVAYFIKRIYASIGQQPLLPTNQDSLYNYITAISNFRTGIEQCRDYESITNFVVDISKNIGRPKNLIAFYEDPSIINKIGNLSELEVRINTELGETFRSWLFKSGNKALHELKTGKVPSSYEDSKGKTWDWAKLEPKVTDNEGKEKKPRAQSFQLKHATDIQREGGQDVVLTSSKQLEEMFNFRGIQSGNWVLKDKTSAEFHMKATAEAMLDMSDVLGIDAKHLGLNGNLAIAFGARGKGGALAHYERFNKVINITKMKGGGSLGHEYFHALDNLIRDLVTGEVGDADFFATRDYEKIQDKEISEAFKQLTLAMTTKKGFYEFEVSFQDSVKPYLRDAALEFAHSIGVNSTSELNAMSLPELQKFVESKLDRNRFGRHKYRYGYYMAVRYMDVGDLTYKEGKLLIPMNGQVMDSDFMRKSIELDKGRSGQYWSKQYEMAARAFSTYTQDRLREKGRRNDYLAYADDADDIAYPLGDEREVVNQAFDNLFKVIREKQVFEKASQNDKLLDSLFGGNQDGDNPINLAGMLDGLDFEDIEQTIVDIAAQTAETSIFNTEQPKQDDLVNDAYRKAAINISGIPIMIENPSGSTRRGTDEDGHNWATEMSAHYGYIEGTMGEDGDEIDVFVVQGTPPDWEGRVFILYQVNKDGSFDEHKVVIGERSKARVMALYQAHYDEQISGLAAIKELSLDDFKIWMMNPDDGMFDSAETTMLDNWLADGKFDTLPIKKLDISKLEAMNEPKASTREPIVVLKKGSNYLVVHGNERLSLARKISDSMVPAIVLDQSEGFTMEIIKKAIKKCGSVVHAEALAAIAEQCVTKEALKSL